MSNTFGTNGSLLKAYYDLILEMLLEEDLKKINPYFLRVVFYLSTNKFGNNQQQDVMEFLSILLNNLHEDVNSVIDKPYMEIEDQKENEKESDVSERLWNCHKLRENSIIVDLFQGHIYHYFSIIII